MKSKQILTITIIDNETNRQRWTTIFLPRSRSKSRSPCRGQHYNNERVGFESAVPAEINFHPSAAPLTLLSIYLSPSIALLLGLVFDGWKVAYCCIKTTKFSTLAHLKTSAYFSARIPPSEPCSPPVYMKRGNKNSVLTFLLKYWYDLCEKAWMDREYSLLERATLPLKEPPFKPPLTLTTGSVSHPDHGNEVRIEFKGTNALLHVLMFNPVKSLFLVYGLKTSLRNNELGRFISHQFISTFFYGNFQCAHFLLC